jgi:transcriptional regulator of acetoin/glycerol metabolism
VLRSQPIVKLVERVVERLVFQPSSADNAEAVTASALSETGATADVQTIAQTEPTMILAVYRRSNRRALLTARLPGIGKATMYRKLQEMKVRTA